MKRLSVAVMTVVVWVAVAVQTAMAASAQSGRVWQAGGGAGAIEAVTIALFLSMVANRLVEALVVPLFERLKIDRFWLLYVGWVVAGLLVAASDVNVFDSYIPSRAAGQLLTIVVCGGGSNLISDLFKK